MPPRRKVATASPAPVRATRSRTARDPSQEFIELPPPTRRKSTTSTAPSTSSGEKGRSNARVTKASSKPAKTIVKKKSSGKSLRRHFTIDLPAQALREAEAAKAARIAQEAEASKSTGPIEPTSPPKEPDTPTVAAMAAGNGQDATGSATPSPSRASPWGFSNILNSVRRVLSPFPPSRKLQLNDTGSPQDHVASSPQTNYAGSPQTNSTPNVSVSSQRKTAGSLQTIEQANFLNTPTPSRRLILSPITEVTEPSISEIQKTPATAMISRKRKQSITEEESPKKRKLDVESPVQQTPPKSPAAAPKTPTRTPARTPGRRSSRSVRIQRQTPLLPDPIITVPHTYNTFTVPDGSASPEERPASPELDVDAMIDLTADTQEPSTSNVPQIVMTSPGASHIRDVSPPKSALKSGTTPITASPKASPKPADTVEAPVESKKRKRVKIDDLEYIPSRRPGQSAGTFALLDEFFDYDQDSVEIDESQLELCSDRPTKKARFEDNVFEITSPKSPDPKTTPSPKKTPLVFGGTDLFPSKSSVEDSTASPQSSSPANLSPEKSALSPEKPAPSTPNPDPGHLPAALQRKRSEAEKYKPTKGSRLREMQRLSSLTTVPGTPSFLVQSMSMQDTSMLDASAFNDFSAVISPDGDAAGPPELAPAGTSPSPTTSPATSPPTPTADKQQGNETLSTPTPSKLSSPLMEMPTPVPNPSTYSLHDGSGPTWNFPGGTPLTDLFTEEEIAYAQANPPTDDEVLEYYAQFLANYKAFLASGGADLPLEHFMAM